MRSEFQKPPPSQPHKPLKTVCADAMRIDRLTEVTVIVTRYLDQSDDRDREQIKNLDRLENYMAGLTWCIGNWGKIEELRKRSKS